jgi:signal transduction histidine kinase
MSQIMLTVQLEKLVSKRTAQLDAANRELSTLFYNASHGMTAPLTTLLGLFGLGKLYAGKDDNLALVFNKAGDVVTDAQHMFYKFKFISELEAACQQHGELDLVSMLSNVAARHNTAAKKKKLKLITELNRSCEIISFSENILQTLIDNLVENAIQFHHRAEDGFVKIKVTCLSDKLIVVVEDNGRGISKEHLAGIFDMYTRYNELSKGIGIGLYLVKKTVEKLNGTVSLQTELNRGSTFEIKIPL